MKAYGTEVVGLLTGLIVLTLLAFASAAHAEEGRGAKGFSGNGGQMISERMAKRLELDETQQQSVENIITAAKPEFEALREQKRLNREALSNLDVNDVDYSVALEQAAAENGRLATEATLLFSRVQGEVSAVLTEEQRVKFDRMNQRSGKKRGKRGGREGRRGGRGDQSDRAGEDATTS